MALSPGMRIDLGDCRLDVAERVDEAAAGMTVSVPAGLSVVVPAVSARRRSRRAQRVGRGARRTHAADALGLVAEARGVGRG